MIRLNIYFLSLLNAYTSKAFPLSVSIAVTVKSASVLSGHTLAFFHSIVSPPVGLSSGGAGFGCQVFAYNNFNKHNRTFKNKPQCF